MTFMFGPSTDTLGMRLTVTADGTGGFNLSCPKYGTIDVSSSQLADPQVQEFLHRLEDGSDFYTNWRNLCVYIGLPDPGETQEGSPE